MDLHTGPVLFTYDALSIIGTRLDASESPNDFLAEVDAIAARPGSLLPVAAMADLSEPLDPRDDAENATVVFETLGQLDRANAADPRLWSYLALVVQREYMSARWSLDAVHNWKARVLDRWLMSRPTRRALVHNGIARLWWIAELTSDPRLERSRSSATADPYYYTRWAFGNEDRIKEVFERELGSSPSLMWAVVEELQAVNATSQSALVRTVAKEVRLRTGYRSLETLDQPGLHAVVRDIVHAATD